MKGRLHRIRYQLAVIGPPVVSSLVLLKYSPVIVLGGAIGFSIFCSYLKGGLKQTIYCALCFTFFFYFAFGLPVHQLHFWSGGLFWLDSFNELCVFCARTWNEVPWFGSFQPVIKVTLDGVREYAWIAPFTAGFYIGFLFVFDAKAIKCSASEGFIRMLAFPARLFSFFSGIAFSFWIKIGKYAYGNAGSPIIAGTTTLLVSVFAYGGITLSSNVRLIDVRWSFEVLCLLPFLGCCTGLILGAPIVSKWLENKDQKEDHTSFVLGNTFEGKPYKLTEKNLGYHVEIIAPTGSGKTNLLKGLIADRIQKGHGVIFLDYKAEFDMISWIHRAAKSVNRENELRLLSLSDRELSVPYNPIKDGNATDIHSSLMNAMTWSEQYYRAIASVTLMTLIKALCSYRDKTLEHFHLGHIYEFLDQPGLLRALSDRMREMGLAGTEKLEALASRLDKPNEKEKISGLMANLDQLLNSSAGELLSTDVTHGSYGVYEAILEGRITIMLMNSLKLKESARIVGKTIVQDFIRYVGDHYSQIEQRKTKPITLIIDEFANCAIPEFIELLDRARGAGIGIVMAHQARADLREVSPEFQSRIEVNSNTTLVSGVKDPADAEYYSGMLGTRTTTKETSQKREGLIGDQTTGMKSVRSAEEFILHPNVLKTLDQGKVFVISRTTDPQWGLVNVFKAPDFPECIIPNSALLEHLKQIRASYLHQKNVRYIDTNALKEEPSTASPKNSKDFIATEAWQ